MKHLQILQPKSPFVSLYLRHEIVHSVVESDQRIAC